MKTKRLFAMILSALMLMTAVLSGCGKQTDATKDGKSDLTDSVALIPEETVLKVTADMTRKQLYELFGETYGQETSGRDGFLATYIVADRYIYSVSVFNDDAADTQLGYDGQAILNSLKNGRTLTTQRGMTVSAEDDLKAEDEGGFKVKVDYTGKYTAYMNGCEVKIKDKVIDADKKLTGKKTLSLDVLAMVRQAKQMEQAALEAKQAAQENEDTTDEAAEQIKPLAENRLLGFLEIKNDADETVYVEIYTIAGETFVCRVRQ